MMKNNIKLVVAYDGTGYLGWQKTFTGRSIEEELQKVLEQILQETVLLQAASRTDAGVHAQGQVVNFFTAKELDFDLLKHGLNCLLPKDIVVLKACQAHPEFHPTLDSIGKEYHYAVCTGPVQLPQHRFYSWHFPKSLASESIRKAAQLLIGERDFAAFCNFKKNSNYENYVRKVTDITIEELQSERWLIKITGNSFLYKMVRNLVGTLMYVGAGKIAVDAIPTILEGRNRTLAGMTAPAHGLILHKVLYAGD